MALDLSAAALIRAGSGVVYIAAGVLALFLWRGAGERRRVILGLGIVAIATGAFLVPRNLLARDAGLVVPAFAAIEVFVALGAGGALLLAFDRRPSRMPRRVALAIGAGAGALYAIIGPVLRERIVIAFGLPIAVAPYSTVGFALQGLAAAGLGAWAMRVAGADDPPRERRLLAVAILGAFAYAAVGCGDTLSQPGIVPGEPVIFFAFLLILAAPTLAGLVFLARGARDAGALLAAGPLSIALLVALGNLVFPPGMMVGIVRSILAGGLGYAILRLARPHATTRRSVALAPVGLAVVFIVAQIAQNFFSAEYGLLTGGIVAGAFLFAASPIQRAMERLVRPEVARSDVTGQRPEGASATAASERLAQSEHAYRIMYRRATADGRISEEEELALAHLADEAGLTTRRVTQLRHEIDREKGAR